MADYTRRDFLKSGSMAVVGSALLLCGEEEMVTLRGTVEEEIYSPEWRYSGEYHLRIATESGSQLILDVRDYHPSGCSEAGVINKEQIDNRISPGDVLDFRVSKEDFLSDDVITITANHILAVYKQRTATEKKTTEEHP